MNIKTFLSKLTLKDIILILLVIFSIWCYFSMNKAEKESQRTLVAFNDSMYTYKNKLGEEYEAKEIFIQTIADLKVNNKELADELEFIKENPLVVVKTEIKYEKDTTKLEDSINKFDSLYYNVNWNLREKFNDKNFFYLSGYSKVKNDFSESFSYLNKLSIGADLTLDIVEKDKTHFQILTRSGNPDLQFTNIEGAVIDPNKSKVIKNTMKQKNFGIGLYGGYGFSAIPNENLKSGFQVGIGVVWTPSWARF